MMVRAAIAPRRAALGEEQSGGKAHPPTDRSGAGALLACQNSGERGHHLSFTLSFQGFLAASMQAQLVNTADFASRLPDVAVGKEERRALPSGF